jgi:hypothetical protein
MPVELTLEKKVSEALWKASGAFINNENPNAVESVEANVLVKQNGNAFILHATPQGINGQIGKRQILHYTPHQPCIIDMPMKGSKLTFNQIFVTLK